MIPRKHPTCPELAEVVRSPRRLEWARIPFLSRAQSPEGKEGLRRQTERAWEMGIFGAPTFVVDGQLFWGNDRLEQALEWWRSACGRT